MSKIIDETRALVDKIKKDQAYIDYMNFKTLIQSKSELKQKVDEFRNKSFQIQMSQNYGYYNAYEQLIKLTEENEQILSEPLVKEFLIAE